MPDVLFYELISSSEPGRSRCFSKLPQSANPIPITKHIGALLKKELTTHKPAGLPSENIEELNYRFNPNLSKGQYDLSISDIETMREIESELNSDISALITKSDTIETMFPDINKGSDDARNGFIEEIERFIAENREEMAGFLGKLELPGQDVIPDQSVLNESWALFRWLQVNLLFSLDIRRRYGEISFSELTNKQRTDFEHDVLDAHYLIQGVLQGAFATKEKKLIRFFNLLCPDGILVTD